MPAYPSDDAALTLARMWAALAGGTLTDPASRAIAAAMEGRFPGTAEMVRCARRFHSSAARVAVQDGARGVIFAAAGLPVEPQLHAEAARESPAARFLYADPGEEVLLLRRLRCDSRCAAVLASARDPAAVLEAAAEAGLRGPLQAHLVIIASYWSDEVAREAVSRWGQALGAGSSLALSVSTGRGPEGRPGDVLAGVAQVHEHSPASVRSWLEQAGLRTRAPGVIPVRTWPAAAVADGERAGWRIEGAVAVKPGVRRGGPGT